MNWDTVEWSRHLQAWWETVGSWPVWQMIGGGGAVVALLTAVVHACQKRSDRGRNRVDQARPELLASAAPTSAGCVWVEVQNVGPGIARNLRLTFSDSDRVADGGDVLPGQRGRTNDLDLSDSRYVTERVAEPAHLTLSYRDRLGIEYRTLLPTEQRERADGRFNVFADVSKSRTEKPRLRWRDYYRLGQ